MLRRRQIANTRGSNARHVAFSTPTNHDPYPSYSSNEDSENEDILGEEEEEQERLLSEQHGEAHETPSQKRQTDADIANALNNNLVRKKKARVTLTTSQLIGSEGLFRVRHEFGKMRYQQPKDLGKFKDPRVSKEKRLAKEIQASGVYLSKLIRAYEDFAMDIAPHMHYSDTFRKIQDLGGKKELKDYLNVMRKDICKERLKEMYGQEKAEKFLQELEDGFQSTRAQMGEDAEYQEHNDTEGGGVAKRLASFESQINDNEDANLVSSDANQLRAPQDGDRLSKSMEKASNDILDSEEFEASFDDVQPVVTKTTIVETRDRDNTDMNDDGPSDQVSVIAENAKEAWAHDDNDNLQLDNHRSPTVLIPNPDHKTISDVDHQDREAVDKQPDNHGDESSPNSEIMEIPFEPSSSHPNVDSSSSQAMECSQVQDSMIPIFQTQEHVEMTQDTVVFDASQTQGTSQETLLVNASSTQTQQEYDATQDTLILDVSQDLANSPNTDTYVVRGSQDY